ncbi:MAG: DUF3426 domain-containing protein [Chromatiales bacterium]|nr:MAG: DUF3426 domain-containing protein [Chromatiales bacterium]
MFTCCPQCETVFRVTANQLRAARGDVRCGNCAHVFNAMEYLADDLSPLEEEDAPATNKSADNSLEFDAPEQTWGEIFIAAPQKPGDVPLDAELEAITADPAEWRSMLAELGVEPGDVDPAACEEEEGIEVAATSLLPEDQEVEAAQPVYIIADAEQQAANDAAAPAVAANDSDLMMDPALAEAARALSDEARDTPDEVDTGIAIEGELDSEPPPWDGLEPVADEVEPGTGRSGWAVAAAVLAVTLLAQLAHQSRDSLATHPRYGELVRSTYERIGQRLHPEWPLDAFYVRRSEALAGGSTPDALDIKAAVEVTGAQAVGLPLVRVTLRDQWSNTVGRRVFLPDEYLASDLPPIVPPGTRIPVTLSLADPGTAARGYEVDLCLQRRVTGLECQLAERPYQP